MLLLPPLLFLPLIAIPYLLEWVEGARPAAHTYVRGISNPLILPRNYRRLCGTHHICRLDTQHVLFLSPQSVAAAVLAMAVGVLVGQCILAGALVLARGKSWRESGALNKEILVVETMLACLGLYSGLK